ncbi:MAG: hypothetical protein ACRDOJ_08025 [Nocardioidaceae bacterium]
MWLFVLVMLLAVLLVLAVAGLVVAYVAYIQQGREIPRAPWLTDAMHRMVDRWGVPTEPAEHSAAHNRLHVADGGIHRTSER